MYIYIDEQWEGTDAAVPGAIVNCDVAASHNAIANEHERLQRLCDGLRGCGLAGDSVVAGAFCTDRLR
jgi:hypothetical protein